MNVIDNDYLYLSVGEGSPSTGGINTPYDNAQNINTNWGKMHRLNYDGTIPTTNPKFDKESNSSIFSMGHRNPQGLTEQNTWVDLQPLGTEGQGSVVYSLTDFWSSSATVIDYSSTVHFCVKTKEGKEWF